MLWSNLTSIVYVAISQPPRVRVPPLRSDRHRFRGSGCRHQRLCQSVKAQNTRPSSSHLLLLSRPRMPRNPQKSSVPPRRSLPAETYSLFAGDETESDEEEQAPTARQKERKEEQLVTAWKRVVLRLSFTLTQMSRSRVLSRWKEIQAEESAAPRSALPTAKKPARGQDQARRDDLTFVGQPLQPSRGHKGSTEWPLTAIECSHTPYLQAGGGRRNQEKIYWWTCRGCGSRWERVDEARATDGTGQPTSELPTHGRRSAPLRPKAVAKAKGAAHPMSAPEAMETDPQDFELIPQLHSVGSVPSTIPEEL